MKRARSSRTRSLLLHRHHVVQNSRATATLAAAPAAWSVSPSRASVNHQRLNSAIRCVASIHQLKQPKHRCHGSHHRRSSAKHRFQRADLHRQHYGSTHPSTRPASFDARTPASANRSSVHGPETRRSSPRFVCPRRDHSLNHSTHSVGTARTSARRMTEATSAYASLQAARNSGRNASRSVAASAVTNASPTLSKWRFSTP